ncbi:kynureninase [Draconibacterium halophilum]|uniref:Kynureninase n=1 Tax=Draconibacterium halophilum TaxID=2706887 RepID=A0A6C0RGB1_9BACT|nr:kynureninase [Draconibacterium halophilum]QIA09450.1 kynureninase [Draconibacterium halophilum]
MFETNANFAIQKDKNDPLKEYRESFFIADENTIYLDGNSLGRLPKATKLLISEVTEKQWGTNLIESWNKYWYEKSSELGNKIAKLIGAADNEVIVSDNTSTNLYKLAHAALRLKHNKTEIVSDVFNFPTDLYILQGLIEEAGTDYKLVLANSKDDIHIDINDLKSKITQNTALVVLSLVAFKSSFFYNAREITEWAHKKGALVLWDLSHAAGAIPIDLTKTNADLAVGCTYKYLNGGPGSPAFLYVRKDLQNKLTSPIQGWFGDDRPFNFDLNYKPAKGVRRFLTGTPPVINQMAIEPGVDLLLNAGMKNIHKKSVTLSEYFIFLIQEIAQKNGFTIGSPLDSNKRGSHISVKHPEAYRICQALINPQKSKLKIIPDFREPDNIRFGFTPLYTNFIEVWTTVERLNTIIETKEYECFSMKKKVVT